MHAWKGVGGMSAILVNENGDIARFNPPRSAYICYRDCLLIGKVSLSVIPQLVKELRNAPDDPARQTVVAYLGTSYCAVPIGYSGADAPALARLLEDMAQRGLVRTALISRCLTQDEAERWLTYVSA
jgi:hypothetical protein